MTKLKNQIMFLKINIFKSHNRLKISTNSDELRCVTSGKELGQRGLVTTPQNNKYLKKPKLQTILYHTVQGAIVMRF